MAATTFINRREILDKVGEEVGTSEWFEVTQEKINQFADATGDHQWIHVDLERAKQGPFGGTIAHGYFTLSLAPILMRDIVAVQGAKMGLNYGVNRVRFTNPVKVGKRVRLHAKVAEAKEIEPNGIQVTYDLTFEVEGEDKPACIAQTISRAYF
jgi:acyl dehydratase